MRQLLYFCVTSYKICEMRCNSFKFNVSVNNNSFPYHAYSFVAMGFCPITTSLNGTFTVEGNMLVSRRFPHVCHVFIKSSRPFVCFLATTALTPFSEGHFVKPLILPIIHFMVSFLCLVI